MKIIFRVGLVLLKQMLGSVDKLRELQGMYETMERLRNISPDSIKEEQLVQEVGPCRSCRSWHSLKMTSDPYLTVPGV